MKRAWLALLLVGCAAPSIEPSDGAEPRVESFDPALRFHVDRLRKQRAANAADSISRTPADVDLVCLHEVTFAEDRELILARARERFPYIGFVKTDRSTPIEDPRDIHGEPRSVEMSVPCQAADDIARFEDKLKCVQDACVDAEGQVDIACIDTTCKRPKPSAPRCRICADYAISQSPLDRARALCVETPRGEYPFDGQLPAVILSRYPLSDVRAHLFPATISVRGALTARVDAPKPFHVSCNAMQNWGTPVTYPGVFAPNDKNGWVLEEWLAVTRMIELARKLGETLPTVVLGGPRVLWKTDLNEQTTMTSDWDWLRANLTPLVSPYGATVPPCTGCFRDNPIAPLARYAADWNEYGELVFGTGAAFGVRDLRITRREKLYPFDGVPMPVGPFYGVSVRLSW